MQTIIETLRPDGKTTRKSYWGFIAVFSLLLGAALVGKSLLPNWLILGVIASIVLTCVLLTVRRLHDAGWSRWWVALILTPVSINIGIEPIQLYGLSFGFTDVSEVISNAPFVLAFALPSGSEESVRPVDGTKAADDPLVVQRT